MNYFVRGRGPGRADDLRDELLSTAIPTQKIFLTSPSIFSGELRSVEAAIAVLPLRFVLPTQGMNETAVIKNTSAIIGSVSEDREEIFLSSRFAAVDNSH